MWLTYIAVLLVIAAIASIFAGGIFTIIFIPLAIIAMIGAVFSLLGARVAGAKGTRERAPRGTGPGGSALPRTRRHSPSDVSTTPDGLVKARQDAQ
jgi:hypothetical protein